jgi:Flp pilus assembly protein CpaB
MERTVIVILGLVILVATVIAHLAWAHWRSRSVQRPGTRLRPSRTSRM